MASSGEAAPSMDCAASEYLAKYAGKSLCNGLYRVMEPADVERWGRKLGKTFPSFAGAITAFAVDWLGRVFALDSRREVNGKPGVTIFEPGTGHALEVPCDIESFHNEELVEFRDAALAETFFNDWARAGGLAPAYSQCVGYKQPLFLGGGDTVENLELIDIDVYWMISAQLILKLRNVVSGTAINVIGAS